MASRHSGTIRGAGLGSGGLNGIRVNYALPGDEDRESAAQQSPREVTDRIHAAIAAAYKAIPPGGRKPAALRAVEAWKREHHAGIQEAKSWPA